jgi:hypothetical protein
MLGFEKCADEQRSSNPEATEDTETTESLALIPRG